MRILNMMMTLGAISSLFSPHAQAHEYKRVSFEGYCTLSGSRQTVDSEAKNLAKFFTVFYNVQTTDRKLRKVTLTNFVEGFDRSKGVTTDKIFPAGNLPEKESFEIATSDGPKIKLTIKGEGKADWPDLGMSLGDLKKQEVLDFFKSLGMTNEDLEKLTQNDIEKKNKDWGDSRKIDGIAGGWVDKKSLLDWGFHSGGTVVQAIQIHYKNPGFDDGASFHLLWTCGSANTRN